jgi:hypothetical protein
MDVYGVSLSGFPDGLMSKHPFSLAIKDSMTPGKSMRNRYEVSKEKYAQNW